MRLIDADALKENIKRQAEFCRSLDNEHIAEFTDIIEKGFCQEIDNAPTVVEFDGEINKVIVKGVEYVPISERKEK